MSVRSLAMDLCSEMTPVLELTVKKVGAASSPMMEYVTVPNGT